MNKTKLNFGKCPECSRVVIRPEPIDCGVCVCKSAVLVPLKSADEFFAEYTEKFHCTTEEVLAVAMSLGLKKVKKMGIVEFLVKRSEVK